MNKDLSTPKQMHGLTMYSLSAQRNRTSITAKQIFDFAKEFLREKHKNIHRIESENKVYQVEESYYRKASLDQNSTMLCGFLTQGIYGVGTEIKDVNSGDTVYQKDTNNAEMVRHYFHVELFNGADEVICLLSTFRGNGIKTLFISELQSYIDDNYNRKPACFHVKIEAKPLALKNLLLQWRDSIVKKIIVKEFRPSTDLADIESACGHIETELTIKPKRGKNLGKLVDFFSGERTRQNNFVELMTNQGNQVEAFVELNGKKRVFKVDANEDGLRCRIDFPEEMMLDKGMPSLRPTYEWAQTIIKSIADDIYHQSPY